MRTLAALARITAGTLVGTDAAFAMVITDSRALTATTDKPLFVALRGPHFDGHEFVAAAMQQGACGALVERALPLAIPQVVVPDALVALTQYAHAWRQTFTLPVVAVTGSNGKTTTKEMLGAILSHRGPCLVTQGNLNNHIGVPLTLLQLHAGHRAAVIEMGANHLGEIAALTMAAAPTVGVVTHAGAAHLEGFGSLEGVAQGKGELFMGLPATGTAVINADDAYAAYWHAHTTATTIVTFGVQQSACFSARNISSVLDEQGFCTTFELHTPAGHCGVRLRLAGMHNVRNAVGAAAAAFAVGATLEDIQHGLNAMCPVEGRLKLQPALHGATLVDDAYNANPHSVRAGIDAVCNASKRTWLIFADMLELGPNSEVLHAEVGRYAREQGIERLFALGEQTRHTVTAFGANGQWFASSEALIAAVSGALAAGVTVLIKGSRANRLERVVQALSLSEPALC